MTIYDTEEHVCCHSRMGTNAVNLGGEKKNMKLGCQYTCIQHNMKSLAVRHTYIQKKGDRMEIQEQNIFDTQNLSFKYQYNENLIQKKLSRSSENLYKLDILLSADITEKLQLIDTVYQLFINVDVINTVTLTA